MPQLSLSAPEREDQRSKVWLHVLHSRSWSVQSPYGSCATPLARCYVGSRVVNESRSPLTVVR